VAKQAAKIVTSFSPTAAAAGFNVFMSVNYDSASNVLKVIKFDLACKGLDAAKIAVI
jgi:hypothetical protein